MVGLPPAAAAGPGAVARPARLGWTHAVWLAATSLLRGPDEALTALGEWLYMALRLLGPVLLGLA
jgi:hypothetical protein